MIDFNFNPFPTIETARLLLRRITEADINEMFYLRSNEQVMLYLDKAPAKDLNEAMLHFLDVNKDIEANKSITWAICLKGENKMIGYIGIWRILTNHHRGEIGYVLHPDCWNKGFMSEAISAIITYAFEAMRLHSLEAIINPKNNVSAKVLEKQGFAKEGHFRENYFFNGQFLDSTVFSLINKEQ
jgi:[ribosomal protein S5]-alanine N-acetyltransferase